MKWKGTHCVSKKRKSSNIVPGEVSFYFGQLERNDFFV